jgi:HEPN domain-containing protein
MINQRNSLDPEDWKKIARKDWERIKRNLRDDDAEAAGFYLHQALEKYLKAFLLPHGWKLKKIHTLHTLLKDAVVYKPELESFRQLCQKVSGYYIIDRYPLFADSELTSEDIKKDLEEAKGFVNKMFPEEKLND